jgi:hypothetical protein
MKKFIELHKWFVKESMKYVGKLSYKPHKTWFGFGSTIIYGRYILSFKNKLYFPIAYIKFMYYSYTNK